MTFASPLADLGFLAGRILFAAVVGYLALGNLTDLEGSVAYAESKGAPLASVTVPLGSGVLLGGALSILFGAYPLLGTLAVVGFLVPITPLMHDFWNAEGREAENERVHFLKNAGLLGAALAFLATTGQDWPYAVGLVLG